MTRTMKDSGVEWIGQIPEEWDVKKVKHCFIRKNEKAEQEEPVILSLARSGVKIRDISTGEGQIAESYYNYNPVNVGDLLLNPMDLYSGANCSVSKVEGVISPAYMNLSAIDSNNSSYYDYYFKTQYWGMTLFAHGKGVSYDNRWTLNAETLFNYYLPVPSVYEQKKIADFLDEKVGKIDAFILRTKQSIDEYKKYKKAVITEAVTKGLDRNASLQESGIEWIGQIPKDFQCIKLRHCVYKIGDVDHYMPETKEEGIPYVMTGDLQEKVSDIYFDGCKMISEEDYSELAKKIVANQGDVILARYATIGTVSYVDIDKKFIVSYSCVVIKPKENLSGKYLFYYSKSSAFEEELKKYTNSNTQGNVGIDSLYQAKIVLPIIEKQEEIVDYLDTKCAEIDSLISKKEAIIQEMEAYKKSLIYEYVTGKKEVL